MSDSPNKLTQFWEELRRRRVIRVIIVYATAAFVIIELVNNVYETLNLPEWTPALTLIILSIGFPLAIIFSWIFDITPKGIIKTESIEVAEQQRGDYSMSDTPSRFQNSIAVLPFQDMSPQKDQEYFCDGMTEEILNVLTHIGSLKVIARTSAFMFKGKNEDAREIGRKLNVETLLEGSVRKADNELRITAQLIKASDGTHIWSEAYNRELEDVFAIQEEISFAIVNNLKIKLLGKEKEAMTKRHTKNIEAYNLYLKGMHCANLFTPEGLKEALEYFERSLKIDPNYAIAYCGLAYNFCKMTFFGKMPPNNGYPIAIEYFKKALDINNDIAEAHAMMGAYVEAIYHWNFIAAEEEFKKALQINPNCPEVHHLYSYFLGFIEDLDGSIKEAQKAVELDPLSNVFLSNLCAAYYHAHQADKAIDLLKKAIKMNPADWLSIYHLGHSYEIESRIGEAIEEYKKAVKLSGRDPLTLSSLCVCYYLNGDYALAEKLINELEEISKSEFIPPTLIYSYYLVKDDLDMAYHWLEKAFIERDSYLLWFDVCPTLGHQIPDKPKFKALKNKYWKEVLEFKKNSSIDAS